MTKKRFSGTQNIVIILAAIALFAFFTLINSSFASSGNLLVMTKSLVPYAILALGVTFVIATGGIDLSIGTVCIGSAVLAGALCKTGVSVEEGKLWLTIPIILVIGLLFGLLNGFLVAKCKIAPFIATLGSMLVSRGLTAVIAQVVRDGATTAVKYPTTGWFQKVFTNLNGVPIGLVWVLVLTVICAVIMFKTKVGRYILAIGSNEEAARLSGIDVDKYKIIAYAIGGTFAGIAALFYTAANPSLTLAAGNGMELDAIAGVYIGGTSTTGGAASILGTLLGSMILVIIRQGLNLAMASSTSVVINATNITYAVTGVIVVGAVLLDVLKKKSAAKVRVPKDPKPVSPTAILVFGILCVVFSGAVLGLVFGILALSLFKTYLAQGNAPCKAVTAGRALSIIGIVIAGVCLISTLVYVIFFNAAFLALFAALF